MSLREWDRIGILDRELVLYQELLRSGVDVTFFTYGDESDLAFEDRLGGIRVLPAYAGRRASSAAASKNLSQEQTRQSKTTIPKTKAMRFLMSFWMVWRHRGVLAHGDIFKTNQMMGSWVPFLASRLLAKHLIVRCGYEHYLFSLKQKKAKWKLALIHFFSGLSYRGADQVVLTSEEAKDFVEKTFGVDPHRVTVFPNLIETEKFRGESAVKNDRAVFVGRLSEQKNLEALILGASQAGVGLDLVGHGHLEAELRELVQRQALDVRFLGLVPNAQIAEVISEYQIFALTSFYEGNPKSLLEAMSCGLPVLGTWVPGIRTVLEDGVTGLLCETSSSSIAQGLKRLKESRELRAELGANARAFVLNQCSPEVILRRERAVYRQVMEGGFK